MHADIVIYISIANQNKKKIDSFKEIDSADIFLNVLFIFECFGSSMFFFLKELKLKKCFDRYCYFNIEHKDTDNRIDVLKNTARLFNQYHHVKGARLLHKHSALVGWW